MSFPFVDKTSSYQQAVGYYDSDGELMTAITAVNRMMSFVSGGYKMSMYSANTPINGLAVTAVTAFGLTSISYVLAGLNATGTPTTTGAFVFASVTGGTSVTIGLYTQSGVAVTAGVATGLIISIMAVGTPS
jgi:hypothetical protein